MGVKYICAKHIGLTDDVQLHRYDIINPKLSVMVAQVQFQVDDLKGLKELKTSCIIQFTTDFIIGIDEG